jgi:hypothetical protein
MSGNIHLRLPSKEYGSYHEKFNLPHLFYFSNHKDEEGRENKEAEESGEGCSDEMVVRVPIRLKSAFGDVKTMAIANSAYESEVPEAIIPEGVARELGLYPRLPPGTEVGDFKVVGGVAKGYRIKDLVEICVETGDRTVGPKKIVVNVIPGEDEVLLCDKLIDELQIELVRSGEGFVEIFWENLSKKIR